MLTCFHCKAEHPPDHYARVVHNKTALYGPWLGWRMAGRYLVGPDGQRVTPERLRGLAWRIEQEKRIDLAKIRKSGFSAAAGRVDHFPTLQIKPTGRDNRTG